MTIPPTTKSPHEHRDAAPYCGSAVHSIRDLGWCPDMTDSPHNSRKLESHINQQVLENYLFLKGCGLQIEAIAKRLGLTVDCLEKKIARKNT